MSAAGTLYTWGGNAFGQLGHGGQGGGTPHATPVAFGTPGGSCMDALSVSMGAKHTITLYASTGEEVGAERRVVATCGGNTYGQLGQGGVETLSYLTVVRGLVKKRQRNTYIFLNSNMRFLSKFQTLTWDCF